MAFMRTIWVAIRARNYTDRATMQVSKNITQLQKQQNELRRSSTNLMASGLMYTAMSALAVVGITRIMDVSRMGRRVMWEFSKDSQKFMRALGDAFAEVLGPMIKGLGRLASSLAENRGAMRFIATMATVAVTLLAIFGSMKLLNFIVIQGRMWWMGMTQALTHYVVAGHFAVTTTQKISAAFIVMKASLGPALLLFTMIVQMGMMFGKQRTMIVAGIVGITMAVLGLAMALKGAAWGMSVVTFGLAALAGAAALAAMPEFQYGTRFAMKTGPAIVHAGEQLIPAREREARRGEEAPFERRSVHNEFHFHGDIHTKADKESLIPMIRKVLRKDMDNKA